MLPLYQASIFRKYLQAKPTQCAVLAGLTALLWFVWILRMSDSLMFNLTGWLYVVAITAALLGHHISKDSRLAIEWESLPFYATGFFVLWFAGTFYGQVKPEFGGGFPTRAVFYFQQEGPAWQGKTLLASVIDETEQGFYVIPKDGPEKATFVPRSLVAAVDFSGIEKVAPNTTPSHQGHK
jgi:hypothetical protein